LSAITAGFHLAHQVGADVGALGKDATAESGEDRNQGGAETQADQRMDDVFHLRARTAQHFQHRVVAGDPEQAQADDQHAGDGTALESDVERLVEADPRRFGGSHVGAHRNIHADVAGGARQHRADDEADSGRCAKENPDGGGKDYADDANRGVLTVQVGLRAFLNGRGNFLHAVVARRLGQNPLAHDPAVGDCRHRTDQSKHQSCRHKFFSPKINECNIEFYHAIGNSLLPEDQLLLLWTGRHAAPELPIPSCI
jgi:hypothetical protein